MEITVPKKKKNTFPVELHERETWLEESLFKYFKDTNLLQFERFYKLLINVYKYFWIYIFETFK